MPRAYTAMLRFFQLLHDVPEYEEGALHVEANEDDDDEDARVVRWVQGNDERTRPGVTFSMDTKEGML